MESRLNCPFCPQQVGLSEHENKITSQMEGYLLSQSKLSPNLSTDAINTANYVRNRHTTKAFNKKIPDEI